MKKILLFALTLLMLVCCISCKDKKQELIPDVDPDSMGGKYLAAFKDTVKNNPDANVGEIAKIIAGKNIYEGIRMTVSNPVDAELFPGFSGKDAIGSFKTAAQFGPIVGPIPFTCYIFELNQSSDAQGFISNLRRKCNPRWNVCVEAEQIVADSSGNYVFFLMCP